MVARNFLLVLLLCTCSLLVSAQNTNNKQFGTYLRPFSATSLWNSRPINPVFDNTSVIRTSDYYPNIDIGEFATGVFLASSSDPEVVVYPQVGSTTIKDADAYEKVASIRIPHWPAAAFPATGSDGHCEIVDVENNIIHSFWKLKIDGSVIRASTYAWAPLNGNGFGNPAQTYQGVRAVGVPSSAGLIRKHEVNDGQEYYSHALALSLPFNSLSKNPTYIAPATAADYEAEKNNYGSIPEGSLLMLPVTSYNISKIASPALRKIARTLQVYGAYVVDRNFGTPFVIYGEIGSGLKLSDVIGWDTVNKDILLNNIRPNLRRVSSAEKFLDGNGNLLNVPTYVNLLSMRGPENSWYRTSGDAVAKYDTITQSLVYRSSNTKNTTHENKTKLGYNQVVWATLKANRPYRFWVESTSSAELQLSLYRDNVKILSSGFLSNGEGWNFNYIDNTDLVLHSFKPAGGPGRVRGFLAYNHVSRVPYVGNNPLLN